jgi:hypothetical protein
VARCVRGVDPRGGPNPLARDLTRDCERPHVTSGVRLASTLPKYGSTQSPKLLPNICSYGNNSVRDGARVKKTRVGLRFGYGEVGEKVDGRWLEVESMHQHTEQLVLGWRDFKLSAAYN